MTAVAWMAGTSLASWLAAAAVSGGRARAEIFWGMLGPLVAAAGSWFLAERTYRRDPAALTSLMSAAFFAKLVFFGAYVVGVLRALTLDPTPFVVSFVTYFIGLFVAEALLLRRLFAPKG